uniref:BZIP domain-containing protein n=1 Tax=Cricetulus griseus TaxID=10029 RepID=A0A8C2M0Y7_CRIGR
MTEVSFLNSEGLAGDLMSPFDQSGLGAEESLGLLDDFLEVAKASSSEWLAVDELVSASDTGKEDAFFGTHWMFEKMDLKEFDFDALYRMDDLGTMPDELLAKLDDTCDLFAPLVQETNKEPMTVNPLFASSAFLQPFPCSPGALSSTPDHFFSLELGSEVDISEGERKPDSASYITLISQCVKDKDTPSDNDSGICMNPESYLGSPQQSPSTSRGSPRSLLSPGVPRGSPRPKPYDHPGVTLTAKVKIEKLDKKLKKKKMEQNKTAATRYHLKKQAEQKVLTEECRELEKKKEALKEKQILLRSERQGGRRELPSRVVLCACT